MIFDLLLHPLRPARRQPLRRTLTAGLLGLLTASAASALSVDEARHLLTRSGFGAAPLEIEALLPLSREQAVDRLLAGLDATDLKPAPAFLAQPLTDYVQRQGDYLSPELAGLRQPLPQLTPAQETRLTHVGMQEMAQLRVWWLDQMISTRSPVAERLALTWHNHFVSRYFDVLAPRLMYEQLQTVRRLGARNYGELLAAMLRDPAMLVFLDNAISMRKAPNENLAREALELFTLGVGNYSQADIKALARILVGHSVDFGKTWRYTVRQDQLDAGVKTFLGHTGPWVLDDAVRILLAHPRTARFVTEKFYREYVSPRLDEREVDQLAGVLRSRGYDMQPFLRALFLSEGFWAETNRGQLVKAPVELLVGFVRSFGVWMPDGELLNTYAYVLGQELFDPPSVEGWKGGMHWMSPQSVATRGAMIDKLWAARSDGLSHQAVGGQDLLVRLSAETAAQAAVPWRLRVNGQEVRRGVARWPLDTEAEGGAAEPLRPKPMWETVVVPRSALPTQIRDVEVVFDTDRPEPHLFVNWVQVDGQRWPSHLATMAYDPRKPCLKGRTQPTGMLFCAGRVRFDLARTSPQGPLTTVQDTRLGPVNSIIEYATTRLPRAMQPAGRPLGELPVRVADDFARLPATADRGARPVNVAAVLAVAPLQGAPGGELAAEAILRQLTLDPAYNLK